MASAVGLLTALPSASAPRSQARPVPGLAYPLTPVYFRGSLPTPRQCAAGWNLTAPRAALRWLAAHTPSQAAVSYAKGTFTGHGTGYECVFEFVVGRTQVLAAAGPWKSEPGPSQWSGDLFAATAAELSKARFNASVKSNGMLQTY